MAAKALDLKVSPGLVIGMGGTGDWLLSLLKRQLYINYGLVSDTSPTVQFLLLDTLDTEMWAKNKAKTNEGFEVKSTQYIHLKEPPGGFYQWAEDPKNYKSEEFAWFRRSVFKANYNKAADWSLAKGAGQLRQFARMGLFFNFDQVYQAVYQCLQALRGPSGGGEVPVWITGSIAGGTGAGLFMDLPIIAKMAAKDLGMSVRTIGGIVMPEVYADSTARHEQAYAVLRELNRFMAKVETSDQAYGQEGRHDANFLLKIRYRPNKVFSQQSTIFDNLIFFGESCQNEEVRKSYFNKLVDGIAILFDQGGANEFYQRVINAHEEKITDFSTYRIFVPIRLYEQKFKYKHMLNKLDELFPTEENLTIKIPGGEKTVEIRDLVDTFLNKVAPYFKKLRVLRNDDQRIEETAKNFRGKPKDILEHLLGFNDAHTHYNHPEMTPNHRSQLANLQKDVFEELVKPLKKELKKDVDEGKETFKNEVDRDYSLYIDKTLPEACEKMLEFVHQNFRHKLLDFLSSGLPRDFGVSEYYYLLNYLFETLSGKDPNNPTDITGIVQLFYQVHFQRHLNEMNDRLQRELESYEATGAVKKVFGNDVTPVMEAMDRYHATRRRQLHFMQSLRALEILRDAHRRFCDSVLELRRQLEAKNESITIRDGGHKNRYRSELFRINGVLRAAGGSYSSIGITTSGDLKAEDYEAHLEEKVFSELPYADLKLIFNGTDFLVEYNLDEGTLNDADIKLWERIEGDVGAHVNRRMANFDGIIHYLKWAKRRYEAQGRGGDLEKDLQRNLREALSPSQQLIADKSVFSGRLIHGDPRFQDDSAADIREIFDNLHNQLGQSTGVATTGTITDTATSKILFSDKNSLIYFISSNQLDPDTIPSVNQMERLYKQNLSGRNLPWRAKVYHNFKCDWRMWEVERAIMTGQAQGMHCLTSGCFSWVMEHDQMIELFVQAVTAGVVRLEAYGIKGDCWVCGIPGQSYEEDPNAMDVILLTGWDRDNEKFAGDDCMFRALVSFAVNRREISPASVKSVEMDRVETWVEQAVKAAGGWGPLVEKQVEKMKLHDSETFNPSHKREVDNYEGRKAVFLQRIFKYFLETLG